MIQHLSERQHQPAGVDVDTVYLHVGVKGTVFCRTSSDMCSSYLYITKV